MGGKLFSFFPRVTITSLSLSPVWVVFNFCIVEAIWTKTINTFARFFVRSFSLCHFFPILSMDTHINIYSLHKLYIKFLNRLRVSTSLFLIIPRVFTGKIILYRKSFLCNGCFDCVLLILNPQQIIGTLFFIIWVWWGVYPLSQNMHLYS